MIRKLTKLVLLIAAMCLLGISFAWAQGSYNLDEYEKVTGKKIEAFHESPILRTKVAAGELPPVEERLPENPLVMEPWEEVGKYGGTLNYFDHVPDYDHYMREINETWLLELAPSSGITRCAYLGGTILPGVLEFWEQSNDAKTFTFRIRKGLKWSDGVPVTTEDVRYTIEDVIMNKEITPSLPEWANWGGEPVELEVVDKYTFRLKFVKTYGLLIPLVASHDWRAFTLIRPKHYLKQFHTKYTSLEKMEPVMKEKGYSKDEWGKCEFIKTDVSKKESVLNLIDTALNKFKTIDILINNTGINVVKNRVNIDEYSFEDWQRIIEVDLNGVFYCSKTVSQVMVKQKGGRIINIGSVFGSVPARKQIAYVAAKAGVHNLTKAMALELAPYGINVNAVAPGSTLTPATEQLFYAKDAAQAEMAKRMLSHIPLGKPGEPEDVANAVLFLCGKESKYVTGHITVDGGWTCGYTRDF